MSSSGTGRDLGEDEDFVSSTGLAFCQRSAGDSLSCLDSEVCSRSSGQGCHPKGEVMPSQSPFRDDGASGSLCGSETGSSTDHSDEFVGQTDALELGMILSICQGPRDCDHFDPSSSASDAKSDKRF